MSNKLANLPDGVSVGRGRIEVRFHGARDAMSGSTRRRMRW